MNDQGRKKILIAIAIWVILIVVIVIVAVVERSRVADDTVKITNLNDCSANIHHDMRDIIFQTVFAYVRAANDYNGQTTSASYRAEIRDGSCQQISQGDNGFSTTAVVDIPEAQQSWRVQYFWITNNTEWFDLGDVVLSCLPETELIYGDFNCKSVPFVTRNQTDPILAFLPYSQINYDIRLGATTDGKTNLDVRIFIYWFDLENSTKEAAIAKYKTEITNWIRSNNLDPDEYHIVYSVN